MSGSAPTVAGQVLTYNGSNTAIWQSGSVETYFTTSPSSYSAGTASQSGTTITGSGTTFSAAMIGGCFVFANGVEAFVTAFTSATVLTAAQSQTVASQAYTVYYGGFQSDNSGNTSANNLYNAQLIDNTVGIVNNADHTKQLLFNMSGNTSGRTLTLSSAQTTSQTLSFPNIAASDTIVALAATQTLTNKTLTAPIIATIVNTGTLTLPTSTDVLVGRATTDTLSNKSLQTGSVSFVDTTTASKQLNFSTVGATASTTLTLASIQTANRTITFPDVTDTVVTLAATQTLTNKTLTTPTIATILNGAGTLTLPSSTDTLVGRVTTDTLQNKSLNNSSVFHVDSTTPSKQLGFSTASATASTTLTLASIQTVNRTITFPDATDTVVTLATTQTLTNKTLVGTTNTIRATQLATTSGDVIISGSSPPVAGQALVATSATNAAWSTITLSPSEITATSTVLTTSSAYVIIPASSGNMTITFTVGGTYAVSFSGLATASNQNLTCKYCLYSTISGVTAAVPQSERLIVVKAPLTMPSFSAHCQALITASAADSVSIYFATSIGSLSFGTRSLMAYRVG
jgi:hypothetical protein